MRKTMIVLCLITASGTSVAGQIPASGPDYLQMLAQVDSTTSSAIAIEGNGGMYWFDPTPILNLKQVREAAVEQHSVDGVGLVVSLYLTETGMEEVRRYLDLSNGHSVGVIVGRRVLAAPLLLRSGSHQVVLTPDSLSIRQATELVDDLNTRIAHVR